MPNIASPGSGGLELMQRIEALEQYKENMDKKRLDVIVGSGKTKIGLTFAGRITALVTINGSNGDAFATYLVQGYAHSSLRLHAVSLFNGTSSSFDVDPDEERIIFTFPNTAGWNLSVLMIQGDAPTYDLS